MSDIIEIITFFATCLTSIFSILENTVFSGYSILDWICGMMYITITFWGIFSLLGTDKEGVD